MLTKNTPINNKTDICKLQKCYIFALSKEINDIGF